MIGRVIGWIKGQRQWHKDHLSSWKGKTEPGKDGLSLFQNECLTQLESALSNNGLVLTEIKVEGKGEKSIAGLLPRSGRRLWIYLDGAEIEDKKNKFRYFYEEWGFRTPDDMIRKLIAAAIDLEKMSNLTTAST